ncbi:MAG TPA: M48 family metallopeptidase [Tepidisphaeraceae bacterium]|nr:M48 family metallopeptidase [Tepidisphaeraceae bacterium]
MLLTRLHRVGCILLLFLVTGCTISEQKEIEIGRESHQQFERQFGGKYPDAQVQSYVNSVGVSLARYAGRPNLPWQFAVLNSKQVNAFAVPGGYIYVTQGLLFRLDSEAMLAGVLGHEVAHIAHRHSVKQMQRAQTAQGLSAVAGIVGGLFGYGWAGDVTGIVASLSLMKYSRDQEKQSDLSGLRYMAQAAYDPTGMVHTMAVLQQAGGGKGGPQFLSSHPNPDNRLEYLKETVRRKYAGAARSGKVGEDEFRRIVLSRHIAALSPLPVDAVAWCAHCRSTSQ